MKMLKKLFLRVVAFVLLFLFTLMAWAVWGPIGSLVLEPLVRRYGAGMTPVLKISGVNGSLWTGITLNGIELSSGDVSLLKAGRVMVRPDWRRLMRGDLWISDLEIGGLRIAAENIGTLAAHYGGAGDGDGTELKPLRLRLKDIVVDTPFEPVQVDEILLSRDGFLTLSVDLAGVPARGEGRLCFSPLEALSFDVVLGSGRLSVSGKLTAPFNVRGNFSGLNPGEFLSAMSLIEGEGNVGGDFALHGAGEDLKAWGKVSLAGGNFAGIPVEGQVPWSFQNGKFAVSGAKLESLSADIGLQAAADLHPDPEGTRPDRFYVRGWVKNLSMKKVEQALALETPLSGEGGMVDFYVSADRAGRTSGKFFMRLPDLRAGEKQIVKSLRASVLLWPDRRVDVDCSGELFGAKLTGRGGVLRDGALRPELVFSAPEMDSALIATALPGLAALAPSGKLDLTVRFDDRLAVLAELRSARLNLAGTRFDDLSLFARYGGNRLVVDSLKGRVGRAPLDFSGTADLKTQELRFDGNIKGFNPVSLPALAGQVTGPADIVVSVRGTTLAPTAAVSVSGAGSRIAGIPVQRLQLSANYANNRVTVPEMLLQTSGGSLAFHGEVSFPAGREPALDISGKLTRLDLGLLSRTWGTSLTGHLEGRLKVSGPLSVAAMETVLQSDRIAVGSLDIRALNLDASGTVKNLEVRTLSAKIGRGSLEGKGKLTFERREQMNVNMKFQGIDIRSLLMQFGIDGVVGGNLDGTLSLLGTPLRPELALKVTSPLTVRETLVDRAALTIVSPARGQFNIHLAGTLGELLLNLKADLRRSKEGWSYTAETGALDVDRLATAKMPSMKGRFAGQLTARVTGRLNGGTGGKAKEAQPVNLEVRLPSFSTLGVEARDIFLPVRILNGRATVRGGTGTTLGGKLGIDADVSLRDQEWRSTVALTGLDLGKAAAPFLKEGEIVGSADVNLNLNGDYGTLMMVFATGQFRSGSGFLRNFKALKSVSPEGKVLFENIRGSFFWDGKDLWLNPGTQATAPPGDPLYRYFAINGAMGIPGKGLALDCKGRFDVHLLDTVLGAMKGAFQLMTGAGALSGGTQVVRQALGRAVGLKERDFQDVTFQLRGSWTGLQLLNLKIDKSLESYLPLQTLNEKTEERKEQQRKIRFNIRIPAGPGGVEDSEDAQNQFKKQLLDNLLNQLDY